MPAPPFYAPEGLRFSCRQCHNCCRGPQPGWVYVSPRERARIARFLGLSVAAFEARWLTEDPDGEPTLRVRRNGDCAFWRDGCTIYPVRPRQCRTFPFWPENLRSRESWEALKTTCHGVDRGRLYRPEEIRSILHGRATSPGISAGGPRAPSRSGRR